MQGQVFHQYGELLLGIADGISRISGNRKCAVGGSIGCRIGCRCLVTVILITDGIAVMVKNDRIGHDIRREIFQTKRRTVFVLLHDFLVILADCDSTGIAVENICIGAVVFLLNIEYQILLNTADGKDSRAVSIRRGFC